MPKVEEKYSSQYGKKLVKIGSKKSVPSKSSKKSLVLNQCRKKKEMKCEETEVSQWNKISTNKCEKAEEIFKKLVSDRNHEVKKPSSGKCHKKVSSQVEGSHDYKADLGIRSESMISSGFQKSSTQLSSPVLVELFETIYKSGLPNFRGCRIPLPGSKFNLPLWRELLNDYPDKIVCDFLEFGFPLDFDKSVNLRTDERRNHKGARDHPEFIDEYLRN